MHILRTEMAETTDVIQNLPTLSKSRVKQTHTYCDDFGAAITLCFHDKVF